MKPSDCFFNKQVNKYEICKTQNPQGTPAPLPARKSWFNIWIGEFGRWPEALYVCIMSERQSAELALRSSPGARR